MNLGDSRWTPSQHYSVHMSPNMSLYEDLLPQSSFLPTRETSRRTVRYNELRDKALSVHNDTSTTRPRSPDLSNQSVNTSRITPFLLGPTPRTLAGKVKDLISSYLPKSPNRRPPKADDGSKARGLPAPPPELFRKPRPPIATPVPKLAPRPPHPKDLVQLHRVHSTLESTLPRSSSHGRPGSSAGTNTTFSRDRRDSGASVKDLVKTFESFEKLQAAECESMKALELRKKKSVQNWNDARAPKSKTVWKP